ncbi:MAG TPA: TraR/DksA family transcriptional regulator [Gammaproteobacteria bacterium]|nr:TraR/DksA family transcriptional regulator [Gammaproteobacteria bacterium]
MQSGFDAIREKLLQKKETLQKRVEEIDHVLQRRSKPLDKDFAEQAVERENDEVLEALLQTSRNEIKQINRALNRIESGDYFVCARCGEDIPSGRLEAIPYTDLCLECADHAQRRA